MNNEKLEELIPEYVETKATSDNYKKLTDKLNNEIKTIMTEIDSAEYIAGDYVAKKTISYRKSIDEDRLLALMQEKGYESVIRTREYVDADLLENAIYHGEIDRDTLLAIDDCTEKTEVITLKVTKNKKGK